MYSDYKDDNIRDKSMTWAKNILHIEIGNLRLQLFPSGYSNIMPAGIPNFHIHPYYELIYIDNGPSLVVTVNNRYSFDRDDIYIIPAFMKHYREIYLPKNAEKLYRYEIAMRFTYNRLGSDCMPDLFTPFDSIFSRQNSIICFPKMTSLRNYYLELDKTSDYYLSDLRIKALINIIFISLISKIDNAKLYVQRKNDDYTFIRNILIERFLLNNYTKNITLDAVAAYLHLGIRQTERLISSLYGKNYKHILMELRVEKAKRLLRSPEYTVKEIALKCGYTSQRGLRSSFGSVVGISPNEYRKSL